MKKVAFITLGCRYNQFETAEMSTDLKGHNYEIVPFGSKADIYIINTCTVTGKSDLKCRNTIRKAVKQKEGTGKVIVVGCYPETNRKDILAIDGVDMVLGNKEKLNIAKHLEDIGVGSLDNDVGGNSRHPINIDSFAGRTAAYLKVQMGCNMNCSYCIVRVARGRGKSEPIAKVADRTKRIIEAGFKEIVLTGINLGSYGRDLSPSLSLTTLLEKIVTIAGDDARIRLSSINPIEVSDSLIRLIKDSSNICRHLHISLQSGNDYILKQMRRNYDSKLYEELLMRLVTDIPNMSIGTDIIVGFPGETKEMFEDSYNLIKRIPISYIHVFPYSARKGTDASKYNKQIKKSIKIQRKNIMLELGENKKSHFMKNQLGKIGMVLFENKRDNVSSLLKGYTDNYLTVKVEGDDLLMNRILPVRLSHIEGGEIIATIVESENSND